jgi:hypothetical protein
MKPADDIRLEKKLSLIQNALHSAAEDAEKALADLRRYPSAPRFREKIITDILHYIVRLDLSMADVHQARQSILEDQVQIGSTQN